MVTDADARASRRNLQLMMAAGRLTSGGVVGAPVGPARPHALKRSTGGLGNYLRRREAPVRLRVPRRGPVLRLPRALLDAWPDDVVADDMHATFTAMASGRRVSLIDVAVDRAALAPGARRAHLAEVPPRARVPARRCSGS